MRYLIAILLLCASSLFAGTNYVPIQVDMETGEMWPTTNIEGTAWSISSWPTTTNSTSMVTKVIAGTGITLSPVTGVGDVTINSAATSVPTNHDFYHINTVATNAYCTNWFGTNGVDYTNFTVSGFSQASTCNVFFIEKHSATPWSQPFVTNATYVCQTNLLVSNFVFTVESSNLWGYVIGGNDGNQITFMIEAFPN